jgi:hypothetical protein
VQNFPDVVATSYCPGSTPAVKAADLNAMQKEIVALWRSVRGPDLIIEDDLLGDAFTAPIWNLQALNEVSPGADNTPGAIGTLALGGAGLLETIPFAIGSLDFRLLFAMRFPTFNTSPAPIFISWVRVDAQGTFRSSVGFQTSGDPSQKNILVVQPSQDGVAIFDTGVPVPIASYGRFEIRRTGHLWTFWINDVLGHSVALDSDSSDFFVFSIGSGGLQARIDYVKLQIVRLPVSSATFGQALGSHAESKFAVFNGTQDFVDITWTNPFADTNYRLPAPGVFVGLGPDVVTASYHNKTQTGIRVVPSARFTGEVYLDAHE